MHWIYVATVGPQTSSSLFEKAISFLGIFVILGAAYLMSSHRKQINWRMVGTGLGLQLVFALIIFYLPGGRAFFALATAAIKKLLDFTNQGSSFIFSSFATQKWEPSMVNIAFAVLPTIIFFSAIIAILYHLGIMQRVVYAVAWLMQRTMKTSGPETLSAAANIFVGQTEAPLMIKPYVNHMTRSELMTVMTGGFATVAGGVMAIYVALLEPQFPGIAGHLLAASVMSAPAALIIGKIMIPETETAQQTLSLEDEKLDANVIDAASRGTSEGLKLALNVGAMLLTFIALTALLNYLIGLPSLLYNKMVLKDLLAQAKQNATLTIPKACAPFETLKDAQILPCAEQVRQLLQSQAWLAPTISLQKILGVLFWPFAFAMGIPWQECHLIGALLGEKVVLNELIAYTSLQQILTSSTQHISYRSMVIATYALCGFANIGSIGIQIGGIGGIAPKRKSELAQIAIRAMIAGTLAAFLTATIAGILI
ncbi:MAG: nucleoside transporter C-terminal domain-containing protein [Myxococcota bacterium]